MRRTRQDNADIVDAIEAVDWNSLPGPADYYRPTAAREGLHNLARARGHTEAASAASHLAGGGIIHDHSGTVFPAAVLATPLLLQIAEERTGAAQTAALELVEDTLNFRPWPGFVRTQRGVRLCCAITDHIHAPAPNLYQLGHEGHSLLTTAREHWRVDIEETWVESTDTLVFGTVAGTLTEFPQAAELHTGRGVTHVSIMAVEYPATDEHAQVCVRLVGLELAGLHTGATLYSAFCGEYGTQPSDL
ncbi:hypothetical protein HNR06_001011 [Nocardiopsis arvandica]|uniref:Uncharacterized protein n=1 Tax=Nocardiopsis sinuspersici TaxID=501010 RepID=A0A7Z0BJG9_9ACTN|nr:hypothetical protein [Nocardiopsis sinuspersici]NYH51422.1 hypothetical protein [Nocardiopsis sinuspersici]